MNRLVLSLGLYALTVSAALAADPLTNNVPVTGLSGTTGTTRTFSLEVPAGAQNLRVSIEGGSGDADLYTRFGQEPTTGSYDCRPWLNGNNESCDVAAPAAGTWYVMVRAYNTYSGVTLRAAFEAPTGGSVLQNGVPVSLSGGQGSQTALTLELPAGADNLSFQISGGSGDADLYVRHGAPPTLTTYDCRPWLNGNNETCNMDATAGTWYVLIVAYNAYSGLSLVGSHDAPGPGGCGADAENGIAVSHLGNGLVTANTYSSWIRMTGAISAGFELSVCTQPTYGTISINGSPIKLSNGYDQAFSYHYTHLDDRPTNTDSFQVRVTSGSSVSVKTFSLTLDNPVVVSPVQPACGNIDIDADHDGIPDCAEQPGTTFYGMPLYDWGARPGVRDIFIEVDYMPVHTLRDYDGNIVTDSQGNPMEDHGAQPLRESLDIVKARFAARGFAVHFDIGDLYDQSPGLDPDDYDLGGGQEIPFAEYVHLNRWTDTYNGRTIQVPGMSEDFMPNYFETNPERLRIFYYLLFANSQGGSNRGSSGQAPDTFDYWYYLSMGGTGWRMNDDTPANRNMLINGHASTMWHELGHVLGFSHGGDPEGTTQNYKPNYFSSMNYLFQLQGVPTDYADISAFEMALDRYQLDHGYSDIPACHDELTARRPDNHTWGNLLHGMFGDPAEFHIGFSDGALPDIDETDIAETLTLGGFDYTCDGDVSARAGRFDINFDKRFEVLPDYDDWSNLHLYYSYLNFQGGKFLLEPNQQAVNAWRPSQVQPGAPAIDPSKVGPPVGTQELVLPPEAFAELHRLQNR